MLFSPLQNLMNVFPHAKLNESYGTVLIQLSGIKFKSSCPFQKATVEIVVVETVPKEY